MKQEIVLQTENLSIGYNHKKQQNVVSYNINIALQKGQLISLIGGNGAGKSTLLRTITGIQKPIAGDVNLKGKKISDFDTLALSQQLSIVLTEKLPPGDLTVFELIALGRQPYTNWIGTLTELDHVKISEAMHLAEVTHLSDKKHYEISDGQLQKVLIARALAQDTPLILLDEPTTHLDLLHKVSLFRLLKKLTESGKCILFSTHDIDLAISFSDEMILMKSGIVIQGTPLKLISNGALKNLFEDENITFDEQKGKFIYKLL
ncbi:MAG TPA: ABC transporter ATP-binding protein [Flavobacterium sp.]|jgi:iron complex transport system ATP-binding protein